MPFSLELVRRTGLPVIDSTRSMGTSGWRRWRSPTGKSGNAR